MKRSTKMIIASTVGVVVLGGAAFAHYPGSMRMGPGHFGSPHGGHFIERLGDQLELTSAQEAKFDQIVDQLRQMRRDIRKQRRESKQQVLALLDADTFDQQKALTLFTEKFQTIEKRAPDVIAAVAVLYDSLTEEQRLQLRNMLDLRHGPRGDHWRG